MPLYATTESCHCETSVVQVAGWHKSSICYDLNIKQCTQSDFHFQYSLTFMYLHKLFTWTHWLTLFVCADQAPRRFPTRARLRRTLLAPWSGSHSLEAVRLESGITVLSRPRGTGSFKMSDGEYKCTGKFHYCVVRPIRDHIVR